MGSWDYKKLRQTDRQIDGQAGRHVPKRKDRHKDRQNDRQTDSGQEIKKTGTNTKEHDQNRKDYIKN